MAIRWRKNDVATLKKAINNFNKRVTYNQNKLDLGVERVSYKAIVKTIKSRDFFNQTIKMLNAYKSATHTPYDVGGKLKSKWEVESIVKISRANDRKKKKQYMADKALNVEIPLTTIKTTAEKMGADYLAQYTPYNLTPQKLTPRNYDRVKKHVFRYASGEQTATKNQTFYENFRRAVRKAFGFWRKMMYDILQVHDFFLPDEFFELYKKYPETLSIHFLYSYLDAIIKYEAIMECFKR